MKNTHGLLLSVCNSIKSDTPSLVLFMLLNFKNGAKSRNASQKILKLRPKNGQQKITTAACVWFIKLFLSRTKVFFEYEANFMLLLFALQFPHTNNLKWVNQWIRSNHQRCSIKSCS